MLTTGLARIGNEPILRHTQAGEAVLSLSLAVSYGQKDESTGYRPTQWIDAALWGARAEKLQPYLSKGSQHSFTLQDVHIKEFGREDGTTGTKLVARVIDIEFVSNGERQAAPTPQPAQPQQRQPQTTGGHFPDLDDDIPF